MPEVAEGDGFQFLDYFNAERTENITQSSRRNFGVVNFKVSKKAKWAKLQDFEKYM